MKTPVAADTPDDVLVISAILGDLAAFDALVLRYRSAVVRTARMIVPKEDAEDVAQEALLLAFKALPSLEELRKFSAWLYAITRRCAIRYSQRTQASSRGRVPLDEVVLEQVPAIRQPMPGEDSDKELSCMLEAIPRDYALALQLHFFDEMPLKRIAGFLGVSLTTVKWRIYQGKKLLRAQFHERTGRRNNE
jgi:RNA polymerase sigma-70 factor, ECF subfamily